MESSGKRTSFLGQNDDKPGEGPDTIASLQKNNKLLKKKVITEREEKQALLLQIKAADEQTASLKADVSKLNSQVIALTESNGKFTEQVATLEKEKENLETQLADLAVQKTLSIAYESTISSLRLSVNDLEGKLRAAETQKQTLLQELDQIKQDFESLTQLNSMLHSQNAAGKEREKQLHASEGVRAKTIQALEERLRDAEARCELFEREKANSVKESSALREKLASSQDESKKLLQVVESLKSEKQSFETIRRFMEEKTETQKVALEESKQEKAQLIEQLQSALQAINSGKVSEEGSTDSSIELQQIRIEMKFKAQQLAELEEKHKKAKAAKEDATREIVALKKEFEGLSVTNATVSENLRNREKELEVVTAQLQVSIGLQEKISKLSASVTQLERSNSELSQQLKDKSGEIERLNGEMRAKNEALIKLDLQLKSESENCVKFRLMDKEKDEACQLITTQLRDLQSVSEARRSQIAGLEESVAKLKAEKEEMSAVFLTHKDASNQSDSKYKQLHEEFVSLEQRVKIAEHQVEASKSALRTAEQSSETIQKLLEATSSKLASAEAVNSKLKGEYDSATMNSQLVIDRLQKHLEGLQEEITSLKNTVTAMKISKAEMEMQIADQREEITKLTQTLENSEPELRRRIEQLKTQVVDQFKKLESTSKDYQECCKSKVNLIDVNSRLEEDLDRARMELRDKAKLLTTCQAENSEKASIVEALNDALSRHAETEALLANQIMELKNKLMESQSYFLRFDAVKIAKLQNSPARLTLRRMPAGTHVIDIECKGSVATYYDKTLENVTMHPSKANRFLIKTVNEANKEFESVEAEAIVKAVRQFMHPQSPAEYAME